MNKQLIAAIADCRRTIEAGFIRLGQSDSSLIKRGAFGLHIIETLLSEPVETKGECEAYIIQVDGTEMPDPFNSIMKKFKEQIEKMPETKRPPCPRCGNEEISPRANFCKICGLNLTEAKPAS